MTVGEHTHHSSRRQKKAKAGASTQYYKLDEDEVLARVKSHDVYCDLAVHLFRDNLFNNVEHCGVFHVAASPTWHKVTQ